VRSQPWWGAATLEASGVSSARPLRWRLAGASSARDERRPQAGAQPRPMASGGAGRGDLTRWERLRATPGVLPSVSACLRDAPPQPRGLVSGHHHAPLASSVPTNAALFASPPRWEVEQSAAWLVWIDFRMEQHR
jgi:hypothetical protein